jgi:hypothetical protein
MYYLCGVTFDGLLLLWETFTRLGFLHNEDWLHVSTIYLLIAPLQT